MRASSSRAGSAPPQPAEDEVDVGPRPLQYVGEGEDAGDVHQRQVQAPPALPRARARRRASRRAASARGRVEFNESARARSREPGVDYALEARAAGGHAQARRCARRRTGDQQHGAVDEVVVLREMPRERSTTAAAADVVGRESRARAVSNRVVRTIARHLWDSFNRSPSTRGRRPSARRGRTRRGATSGNARILLARCSGVNGDLDGAGGRVAQTDGAPMGDFVAVALRVNEREISRYFASRDISVSVIVSASGNAESIGFAAEPSSAPSTAAKRLPTPSRRGRRRGRRGVDTGETTDTVGSAPP